ncbi:MAG: hypothetical protein AUK47_26690 [Deltaproteobacteria bacterium CG2_30_63_29]|nr:MAG: hypothetical protein AUK47_26690 [Deltaproteobacteria bacterium CG2_30_63_29]PIV99814.1 MAG: hypothetical protein COW42_09830 [Deltaproteobacteria bacterium CG17_big_fil_post_rev_8_21_14_2_50_63_7]PJB38013.1 MAG: hypothetical protein CO108_19690 [Deltaproteobacteria bacterium CG_4_9_14_3_um_filter_63_12]
MLLAGCDPAPKTRDPRPAALEAASRPVELADSPKPAAPRSTPEELATAVSIAERFARLDNALSAFHRSQDGQETARKFAQQRWGLDEVGVELIGSRAGFPAYKLSSADMALLLVVIIVDQEVLFGEAGFRRFLELTPNREPIKWACGFVLLHQGVAREPRGPWNSASEAPRWSHDELVFDYVDNDGTRRRSGLTFDAGLHVTVRELRRW